MKRVELIEAEPAALLVSQRGCDTVGLKPGSDPRHVVFVHERQPVALKRTAEVDCDDTVGFIVRDGVHLDGQCAVAAVGLEGETDFNVIELVGFHDQNLF